MSAQRAPMRTAALLATLVAAGVALAACGTGIVVPASTSHPVSTPPIATSVPTKKVVKVTKVKVTVPKPTTTTTTAPATTTTTAPATTTTSLPPLGAAGGGLVAGHVTAIGDSVMIDQEPDLQADIPGIDVEATVGFQWYQGIELVQQLRQEGRLGAIIVIGLGTNGPFTPAQFTQMMQACAGASRVVFINVHVDQPWQDEVNAALAAGVAQYPKVAVLVNWNALADQNPQWFYSDGTHLPIGGPGAQALAGLVAAAVKG